MSELRRHKHHRKMRSQGGDDSYGNLVELAPAVHDLVHQNPDVAYRHGLLVHSYDDPAAIPPNIPGFLADLGLEGDVGGTKPKRKRLEGDAKAKRKTVTVRLPEGVTGADWDDLLAEAETVEQAQPDTQYEQWRGGIAIGKLLVAVLERFTGRAGG